MTDEYNDTITIKAEDGEMVFRVNGAARLKVPRSAARQVAIRALRCANDLRWP